MMKMRIMQTNALRGSLTEFGTSMLIGHNQMIKTIQAEIAETQVQQIPGFGDLTASALVAAVGDFCTFKSARQFASWVRLVPRHVGTGGKTQQFGISTSQETPTC